MAEFVLEMFTPQKQFFMGEVSSFVCSSADGELCVLSGHHPMLVALAPGEVRIKTSEGVKSAYVSDGFMEVRPDHVMVFSHLCEWPEDIDEVKAKEIIEDASAVEIVNIIKELVPTFNPNNKNYRDKTEEATV